MLGADKPKVLNFTGLKQLMVEGTLEEFKQELDKVPEPYRTDFITRNPDTQTNTLLKYILPAISEETRNQLYEKYLQPGQIQAISQLETIDEKNELFRIYLNDQPDKVPSFLIEAIEAIPEEKRKKVLQENDCPQELSDSQSSAVEKQAALSTYLSERRAPNSLLMEALMNGRREIFEYLKTQGANPQLLIFDSTARTHFDGQHLPFVGNADAFTSDPVKLQAYKSKYQDQLQNIYNTLDELNSTWTTQQKNDNRLLNIAVFFGHKELVASLLNDPSIDPNLLCSRVRPAITHASTNTDFRGEILDVLQANPRVNLDGTGMALYKYMTASYNEFEEFITKTKGRISRADFPSPIQLSLAFAAPGIDASDSAKKLKLLFDNGIIDIELFKNKPEEFLGVFSSMDNSAKLAFYNVVSQQFKTEDYLLQTEAYSKLNLKGNLLNALKNAAGKPTIWNGLVKQVSKDPELQTFLEASAGVSKDIDELNKSVQAYNSRSIGKRIADGITGFFTRINKQDVQDTNDLMTQIKETHTNAARLGIPSLMVDKLITDLGKAKDGSKQKDQALEQILGNAELLKGSSFEDLVQVAEARKAEIKSQRAPEIDKLKGGMDEIQQKMEKMEHKKKMFTAIAEATLKAVAQIPKEQSKRGGRKLLKGAANSILKQISQDGLLANFNREQKHLLKLEIQDIMQRRLDEPIPSTSLTIALEGLKKGEKLEEVAQQGLAKRVVAVCTHYTQLAEKNPPQVAKTKQPELQKKKFTQTVRESQAISTSQTAVSA